MPKPLDGWVRSVAKESAEGTAARASADAWPAAGRDQPPRRFDPGGRGFESEPARLFSVVSGPSWGQRGVDAAESGGRVWRLGASGGSRAVCAGRRGQGPHGKVQLRPGVALGRPGRREPASYPPNTPLCSFQCHMTPTARAPPRPRHSRLPPGPAAPAPCHHGVPRRLPTRTSRRQKPGHMLRGNPLARNAGPPRPRTLVGESVVARPGASPGADISSKQASKQRTRTQQRQRVPLRLLRRRRAAAYPDDRPLRRVRPPAECGRRLLEVPHHRRERRAALAPGGLAGGGPREDPADGQHGGARARAAPVVARWRALSGDAM